jgi:hypothetical protein
MTKTNKLFVSFAAIMTISSFAIAPASIGQTAETVSSLLFDKPYLTTVEPGTTLIYDFKRTTSDEQKFGKNLTDTIRLDVLEDGQDASKRTAHLHIYSGARARNIGPIPHTSGNPAIMIILEQDTYEFQRKLGGQPAYFRNKIRKAMRDNAKIEKTSFQLNGKEISGHKITLTPFKGDPNMKRVPEYTGTTYEFVVSDDVPGGVVSITSRIPASDTTDAPLKEQSMTYNSQVPK